MYNSLYLDFDIYFEGRKKKAKNEKPLGTLADALKDGEQFLSSIMNATQNSVQNNVNVTIPQVTVTHDVQNIKKLSNFTNKFYTKIIYQAKQEKRREDILTIINDRLNNLYSQKGYSNSNIRKRSKNYLHNDVNKLIQTYGTYNEIVKFLNDDSNVKKLKTYNEIYNILMPRNELNDILHGLDITNTSDSENEMLWLIEKTSIAYTRQLVSSIAKNKLDKKEENNDNKQTTTQTTTQTTYSTSGSSSSSGINTKKVEEDITTELNWKNFFIVSSLYILSAIIMLYLRGKYGIEKSLFNPTIVFTIIKEVFDSSNVIDILLLILAIGIFIYATYFLFKKLLVPLYNYIKKKLFDK